MELHAFLSGALTVTCLLVGLFFVRYYRSSRDRLFVFLAITFVILAVNWATLAFIAQEEASAEFYVPRLIAFVVLIAGIVDKNRRATRDR
jgi:hypothetical protein